MLKKLWNRFINLFKHEKEITKEQTKEDIIPKEQTKEDIIIEIAKKSKKMKVDQRQ